MHGLTPPFPCPRKKCVRGSNSNTFSRGGEGARVCKKAQMPTTDKNHLAASGGHLFLKEVFINFVARLVNDREGEQV